MSTFEDTCTHIIFICCTEKQHTQICFARTPLLGLAWGWAGAGAGLTGLGWAGCAGGLGWGGAGLGWLGWAWAGAGLRWAAWAGLHWPWAGPHSAACFWDPVRTGGVQRQVGPRLAWVGLLVSETPSVRAGSQDKVTIAYSLIIYNFYKSC